MTANEQIRLYRNILFRSSNACDDCEPISSSRLTHSNINQYLWCKSKRDSSEDMEKILIAGLGNIGAEYDHTRHNIGFDVADAFAEKYKAPFRVDRLAHVAEVQIKNRLFICIKPTTYMNLSGKALKYWLDKEKIPVERSLTIMDELSLPLSKIRVRGNGSDGGHNGLKDIQAMLGTTNYPRLRFGIGNNFAKGFQVNFVLGRWEKEEKPVIAQKTEACITIIEKFAFEGIEKTMTFANGLNFV
jgi:peptidyl-tRNA hydrolase, PTH1 family